MSRRVETVFGGDMEMRGVERRAVLIEQARWRLLRAHWRPEVALFLMQPRAYIGVAYQKESWKMITPLTKSDAKRKIEELQRTVEMQRQDIHNLLLKIEQMDGEIASTRARIPKVARRLKNR